MKRLALAVALAALVPAAAGCVVVDHRSSRSAVKAEKEKKCPPGHVWSDGECHSKGKGHDKK